MGVNDASLLWQNDLGDIGALIIRNWQSMLAGSWQRKWVCRCQLEDYGCYVWTGGLGDMGVSGGFFWE